MKQILVRRNNDQGFRSYPLNSEGRQLRWHLADPDDGSPVLAEFANTYCEFTSRKSAINYVRAHGYQPIFE